MSEFVHTPTIDAPTAGGAFLIAQAGRMFELLSGINSYPLGYPLNTGLVHAVALLIDEATRDASQRTDPVELHTATSGRPESHSTPDAGRLRWPKKDDVFLVRNTHKMFDLLVRVQAYPAGIPLHEDLMNSVWALFAAAYADGIDTIQVSEIGVDLSVTPP